jgi:hypothetical protein
MGELPTRIAINDGKIGRYYSHANLMMLYLQELRETVLVSGRDEASIALIPTVEFLKQSQRSTFYSLLQRHGGNMTEFMSAMVKMALQSL